MRCKYKNIFFETFQKNSGKVFVVNNLKTIQILFMNSVHYGVIPGRGNKNKIAL